VDRVVPGTRVSVMAISALMNTGTVPVLCCAVLKHAVLCCAELYCIVLCCAVLCCAVLCCTVLCCAVLCSTVLYRTVLYGTVRLNALGCMPVCLTDTNSLYPTQPQLSLAGAKQKLAAGNAIKTPFLKVVGIQIDANGAGRMSTVFTPSEVR
jgi:hypothetical protein